MPSRSTLIKNVNVACTDHSKEKCILCSVRQGSCCLAVLCTLCLFFVCWWRIMEKSSGAPGPVRYNNLFRSVSLCYCHFISWQQYDTTVANVAKEPRFFQH